MNPLKLTLMLCLITLNCRAQLPSNANQKPIKGTFYVSVDDACTIFVNGQKAYETGIGLSRSPELELKVGDRIVVHLRNDVSVRYFFVLFASSDGRTVISFRRLDFKIVPDIDVTDFTPEVFRKWEKFAKTEKQKNDKKPPVKSFSEFIWGDLDKCILAVPITPQMVSQKPN
jgi:hypothetical protein